MMNQEQIDANWKELMAQAVADPLAIKVFKIPGMFESYTTMNAKLEEKKSITNNIICFVSFLKAKISFINLILLF